jgi:hypothetical protein
VCISRRIKAKALLIGILCQVSDLHTIQLICPLLGTGLLSNKATDAFVKEVTLYESLACNQALSTYVPLYAFHTVFTPCQNKWTNTNGNKMQALKPSCGYGKPPPPSDWLAGRSWLHEFRYGLVLMDSLYQFVCVVYLLFCNMLLSHVCGIKKQNVFHLHDTLSSILNYDTDIMSNVLAFVSSWN